jgi:PAS domain S-box-containing protein
LNPTIKELVIPALDYKEGKSPDRRAAGSGIQTLAGGGEMGALMRAFHWSSTPLGDIQRWPQSLKTAVRIILNSRYPMFVWWGPELINLYNDPYRAFLGIKHPDALGKSAREVWAEIWDQIGPRTDAVLLRGESTFDQDLLLLMERHGYVEETYFTFSYSPVPDDNGKITGLFCAVTEATQQIIGERRLALLRDIASAMAECRTPGRVCEAAARSLSSAGRDLPFSLIYLRESDSASLRRAGEAGIPADHPAAPASISLVHGDESEWPVRRVMENGETVLVEDLPARFQDLPLGEWNKAPQCAVLLPIARQGQSQPAGVFVAGLNPYRKLGEEFKGFLSLLSNQIAGALANAVAYETERRRAESLAELDRAKTAFFSNVSHEFRTPLTLMLGPTEDALATPERALRGAELETVHRHELRLLKLVNTLLDFSRLEAGRVKASYLPTDLCAYTLELISVFGSAVERAGLNYVVECDRLPQEVYVDHEMWEKIVLNLISNALKSTFEGSIAIRLRDRGDHAELQVRDTGTGIAEAEIPRLFERFRRIENARRRTHEGSGIGLALVHELVNMHGGRISVQSCLGKGTSFTVAIPYGTHHLPQDRIITQDDLGVTNSAREAFVQEALSWLPGKGNDSGAEYTDLTAFDSIGSSKTSVDEHGTVLLVDDNRDMREYVRRLLSSRFQVVTAQNGREALAKAHASLPDLILSDVMMPEMDGFQLLAAVRQDQRIASVPLLLLSARAGEESLVEGMQSGADDYLVKPFTARELVARVEAHIKMARFRRTAVAKETQLQHELDQVRRQAGEALDHISDLFITFDSQWRYTYLNTSAQKAFGCSMDEFLGHSLWEKFPASLGPELEREYRRSMELRIATEFEYSSPVLKRNFRIRTFPAPDGGLVVSASDITERRRAEAELRIKQEYLLLTQKAARIGSWELDVDAEQLTISPEFAEIIGLPAYVSRLRYAEFLNSLFVSGDRHQAKSALERAIRGGKEFSVELRLKRPDGSVRIVSNRGKVFYNQGAPVVLGVLVDVTPSTYKMSADERDSRARAKSGKKNAARKSA